VGFQLLPARFTLTQLQRVYEAILGRATCEHAIRPLAVPAKGRKSRLIDVGPPA
jgi:hypothetical protein